MRHCIKTLPNTLILTLKRFEFNFDTMRKYGPVNSELWLLQLTFNRVKINDFCHFPMELNMEPYTREGLARQDIMQSQDNDEEETEVLLLYVWQRTPGF